MVSVKVPMDYVVDYVIRPFLPPKKGCQWEVRCIRETLESLVWLDFQA
jgi:hypothetical protein